jgi:hypothetical protein
MSISSLREEHGDKGLVLSWQIEAERARCNHIALIVTKSRFVLDGMYC